MALNKVKMPEQEPEIRNKNFKEVSLGYEDAMAIEEAQRCLNCKQKPCVAGCPVNVKIPEFIQLVADGKFEEAYYKIKETNSLPAVCGRVCPQESQCEQLCVRGKKGEPVAIGRLERFVADWYMKNCKNEVVKPKSNGIKVAVVGSGPSGLTCAGDLAKKGYQVTGTSQTGRSRSYNRHLTPVGAWFYYNIFAACIMIISYKTFKSADCNRFSLNPPDTLCFTLALLRADPSTHCRQGTGMCDDLICFLKITFRYFLNKGRDINLHRTSSHTRLILAVKASFCFVYCLLSGISKGHFQKISSTI
jgi:hypothetical protein